MSSAQIICVDDMKSEAALLQQVLRKAGYAVDVATNGFEALDMMRTKNYDLAIVDHMMPAQTGLELLQSVVNLADKPAIIILTAYNDPAVANQAYELGVNHFIIKDDKKNYLLNVPAAVRQTLAQRETLAALASEKQKVERINLNLMLLNNTSHLLTSTQDIGQITTRFVQTIASVLHTQGATVWLYPPEEDCQHLICGAAYSAGRHISPSKLVLPLGEGIAGWVADNGQSVMTNHVRQDPRFSSRLDSVFDYPTESMLAVPLKSQQKIVGVLQLINKQNQDFDSTDVTLAGTLAAYAANAIVNAQLMEQLRRQNEELALQNADLDAYSDSVAHDLKNPITQFLSYADDLRENFAVMASEEIDEHLTTIVEQSRRMNDIIEELLLLARIRMSPNIKPNYLDMSKVVDNAMKRLKHDIDMTQAQIVLPEAWPTSVGYGPWIEGVWYNYMSNGLRYGGTPPRLIIDTKVLPDGTVRYQVSDNGQGLTQSEQNLLFKPFPKLQYSRKGNGLGLVIVRRVMEHLNGTFGVESSPGLGSSFYFTLPSAL